MMLPMAPMCLKCKRVFKTALRWFLDDAPVCAECFGKPWQQPEEAKPGDVCEGGAVYMGRLPLGEGDEAPSEPRPFLYISPFFQSYTWIYGPEAVDATERKKAMDEIRRIKADVATLVEGMKR